MQRFALAVVIVFCSLATARAGWKAGVAKTPITPPQPMFMSGYASRDHAATGKLTDLWAKALVLEDESGHRGVVITLDLVGIDRTMSQDICGQLEEQHGFQRADIAICTSHTHSGPVLGNTLRAMYDLSDDDWQRIDEQTEKTTQDVIRIVGEAIEHLQDANLKFGIGQATFAVNRRENNEPDVPMLRKEGKLRGPVDHEAPVLSVSVDGELKAVLFGYACHATVLSGYDWCGDWPGYAQMAIEEAHPGATALFFAGCGADQNPLPRRTVELAKAYGKRLATAVDEVLNGDMRQVAPTLKTTYEEIDLPFASVPTQEVLEATLAAENIYEVRRAKYQIARYGDAASIPTSYPYPIQTWRLGDVTGVFLGGEVVVDYSLEIKGLPQEVDFVAGYSNDVMAYIPSERVLAEGRYEGATSMIYYGQPSPWETGLEKRIVDTVQSEVESLSHGEQSP